MRLGHHVGFLAAGWVLFFGQAGCRLMMDIPDGPPTPAQCGDGVRQGDEACDGSDLAGATCESLGFLGGGTLSCAAGCTTFDTTGCENGGECGDGVRQGDEACDGQDLAGETCESQGFTGGTLACAAGCELDTSACIQLDCGNGIIDEPAEECDGAEQGGVTCGSLGYLGGGELVCSATCKLDESACVSICGNEVIEPGESCDPGSRPSPGCDGDCQVNPGWECTGEPSMCVSTCGDGIITSAEDCEGADLNGQNCTTFGLGYGPLACGDDCMFDTSACYTIVSVLAGERHTCAVTSTGAAHCWGSGAEGQLGTGNTADANAPVPVAGGLTFVQVVAGGYHSCGVRPVIAEEQDVYCWGLNSAGQLGDGSTSSSTVPVMVGSFPEVNAALWLTAGDAFTCGHFDSGPAFCWGENADGQLGTGNYIDYHTPRGVQDLSVVTTITAGYNHACAIENSGGLYCWGANGYGQLGIGETGSPRNRPTFVSITDGPSRVDTGDGFTCAISYSGIVYCWGRNDYGQLGNGTLANAYTPTQVTGISNPIGLALGKDFACVLLGSGGVRCWGRNQHGQLGNNTSVNSSVPVEVQNLTDAVLLTAGGGHVCARVADGTMRCWGDNGVGQVGAGQPPGGGFDLPVPVAFH